MSRFRKYPPPVPDAHPLYPASTAEALTIQRDLIGRLELSNRFGSVGTIAGIDVGYDIAANASKASIVVLDFPGLRVIEAVTASLPTGFPYIPGLLSFREIPVILEALKRLRTVPDLLMVDGQGIAHPRRMGIAAHLGLVTGLPTIGVAKSRLCGQFEEPGLLRGDRSDLIEKGERIGVALRSRDGTRPLFISPGHRIDIETSVEFVLKCLTRYRLPEPTRLADRYSKKGAVLPTISDR